LLGKYSWYWPNAKQRTWPAGSKKPNDLGLFDLHGHVFTWCQERYQDYPQAKDNAAIEDKEDVLKIDNTAGRVVRGGAFNYPAASIRSAHRNGVVPTNRHIYVGFRLARTFP
jgi:formylglycine-generating enzyme required for sulfatase activity